MICPKLENASGLRDPNTVISGRVGTGELAVRFLLEFASMFHAFFELGMVTTHTCDPSTMVK